MSKEIRNVDCVIEVHDARIPITGRNPLFKDAMIGPKPHILLLNKIDLADMTCELQIDRELKNQGIDKIFYTNLMDDPKSFNKVRTF